MSSRSARNSFLAAASAVGVVAAVLEIVSASLILSDFLSFPYPTALKVSGGLDVLSWVFALAAFGTALAAFLLTSRSTRTKVLAVAAGLFVGHGLSELATSLIRAFENGSRAPWQFTASDSAGAAAGASLAIAAVLVAIGVLSTRPDGLLGWASIGLAGNFALLCVAYSFELAGFLMFITAPWNKFSGGLGTTAGGQLVVAAAAVVAAVAFFVSNGCRKRGATWQAQREGSLGIAAIVFAVGFLVSAVGVMLLASDAVGRYAVEEWLQAVATLLLVFAALAGVVGFFLSRRDAERRASSPVAPAPAG